MLFAKEWDIYKANMDMVNFFNKLNRICLYRYLTLIFPSIIFTVPKSRMGYKVRDRESVNEFSLLLSN